MPSDIYMSLLFQNVDVTSLPSRLLNILSLILAILGIIGNLLGFLVFSSSRRFRRISSTYVHLASYTSIINILCVIRYAAILHSTTRQFLRQLVGETRWACKFYEFSFSFRILSSWIILFWMFERLSYISRRLRAFINRCCSFKYIFMIPIAIIIFILICVIGPPVYMYEPWFCNGGMYSDAILMDCKVNSKASIWWQTYFQETHLGINHFTVRCLFSELIPTGAILLFEFYMTYHAIQSQRYLREKNHRRTSQRLIRVTTWMSVILILHSTLFLVSVLSHILGHFLTEHAHEAWWVLLAVLMNCSLNFYVYCLSGKIFRNEICRFLRCCQT